MSRVRSPRYAGATGKLDLGAAARLGSGWACQPKIDGLYVELELGTAGEIVAVRSRTGRPVGAAAATLIGERVGAPNSVLVAELEAHTERGRAAAAANPGGTPRAWTFDALRIGGRDLVGLPYSARRDELCRAHYDLHDIDDGHGWRTDRAGQAYDARNGRWCLRTERGWRRAPIVPQVPLERSGALYDDVVGAGGEGIVVVALDAPVGARRAKRKVKPKDTLDCVVVDAELGGAVLRTFGREFRVGCRRALRRGEVLEVAHEGWYSTGAPRFPRIVRRRPDLAAHAIR